MKVGVLIVLADSYGVSIEIDAGWGRGVGGLRIRDLDGHEALRPLSLRDVVGGIIRKPI